jgi:hypothetical protein
MSIDYDKFEGHTPGPWDFTRNSTSKRPCGIYGYEDEEQEIELCHHAVMVPEWPFEEQVANTRLIAAAPELLARCRELEAENNRLREAILSGEEADDGR